MEHSVWYDWKRLACFIIYVLLRKSNISSLCPSFLSIIHPYIHLVLHSVYLFTFMFISYHGISNVVNIRDKKITYDLTFNLGEGEKDVTNLGK
jgi:hypothetical protein